MGVSNFLFIKPMQASTFTLEHVARIEPVDVVCDSAVQSRVW
jgi:hypothetical protein